MPTVADDYGRLSSGEMKIKSRLNKPTTVAHVKGIGDKTSIRFKRAGYFSLSSITRKWSRRTDFLEFERFCIRKKLFPKNMAKRKRTILIKRVWRVARYWTRGDKMSSSEFTEYVAELRQRERYSTQKRTRKPIKG